MGDFIKSKTVLKYACAGIILGVMFPLGATVLEMVTKHISLSINNIILLHKSNLLLIMIDSAPLFLGVTALIAGINQFRAEKEHKKVEETLKEELEVKNKLSLIIEQIGIINTAMTDVSKSLYSVFNDSRVNVSGIDSNLQKILSTTKSTTSDIDEFNVRVNNFVSSVQVIEASTENANSISKELANLASEGEKFVVNSIKGIGDLNSYAKEVNSTVIDLDGKIKEVNKIINLINSIYDRTSLLALNAAIEAAKAGEFAGGFSVIAEQIKVLSDQSKDGVNQILQLINSISEGSKKSTLYTENIAKMIENQAYNSNNTKDIFKDIFSKIETIASLVLKLEEELKNQVKDSQYILLSLDNIMSESQKTSLLCYDSVELSKSNQSQLSMVGSTVDTLTNLSNKLNLIFK